jgi:cyanophycinase
MSSSPHRSPEINVLPRRKFAALTLGILSFWTLAALVAPESVLAENSSPISPAGIRGTLWIAGGGEFPTPLREKFCELAGGTEGHLIIIPTASEESEQIDSWERWLAPWQDLSIGSVRVIHISKNSAPTDEDQKSFTQATSVWFAGGQQSRLSDRIVGTAWEGMLQGVLDRDGLIGGTSAGAAIQSKVMIASGNPEPVISQGLDLLPDAIIDQHFTERNRLPRLRLAIEEHPECFGIGIDEGTSVLVRGRTLQVVGQGSATLVLPASKSRPEKIWRLSEGERADLTALRRMVLNRRHEDFPYGISQTTDIAKGSLIIVGGGGLPEAITRKFIQLAGGEEGHIVVLPTAAPDPLPERSGIAQLFQRMGAGRVTVLTQRNLEEVESDEFLETLQNATGIWFGGGRQWRFVDAYAGTKAERAFHDLLARGGVIAGSSAGASIQGEYMARGNPLGNLDIMSEGYEKGLGFLPGVAIDQHFTQRSRMQDLESLVKTYPQFLGIGIDEGTAILVQGTQAQVIGQNDVYFLHQPPEDSETASPGTLSTVRLSEGSSYDLLQRQAVDAPPEVPRP